ncbi:MAG: MBL fold metallo-hydrolase [Candidatus Bathyarchaeia archaeon]
MPFTVIRWGLPGVWRPMVEIGWYRGFTVRVGGIQLIFDPESSSAVGGGSHVFVSHAHADHVAGLRSRAQKYSTAETRNIFEGLNGRSALNFHEVRFKEPVRIGEVEVTPINAGHMLGSAQFLISTPNLTILYTGDINCVDTLTTRNAVNIECDILVMEATYGDPTFIFPSREETYAEVVNWTINQVKKGLTPVFDVYAAGKAQELVRLFNLYTNLTVATDSKVAKVNRAYSESGLRLNYEESDLGEMDGEFVYLAAQPNLSSKGRYVRALATGWALKMGSRRTAAFPLSSHADFNQLVKFVKGCGAKVVYTFTGYTATFTDFVERKLGLRSRPLPALSQRTLYDFY